jgi:hypothetical protein
MPGVNDIPKILVVMSLLVGARDRSVSVSALGAVAAALVAARKHANRETQ